MKIFCDANGVRYDICGKLIVATNQAECAQLEGLRNQGVENGLVGLRLLSLHEAREIEPHVGGIAALHVPEEGIVDYPAVGQALVSLIRRMGGTVTSSSRVYGLHRSGNEWVIETTNGEYRAKYLITCAGLHADAICRMAGEDPPTRIIPFRGEYYRLVQERSSLVRHLIYPLPDPTFPFLGVHLTRRINGEVDAGPNAIMALAREGYDWTTINVRDSIGALSFPGVWRFIGKYPGHTWREVRQSLSKRRLAAALQRLVPSIGVADLVPAGSGVRAQAMRSNGSLVEDFLFHQTLTALHVLNAPSPAATASLAIGEEIATRALAAQPCG
jgi:L-2-hydroxyglutarate oxidase